MIFSYATPWVSYHSFPKLRVDAQPCPNALRRRPPQRPGRDNGTTAQHYCSLITHRWLLLFAVCCLLLGRRGGG